MSLLIGVNQTDFQEQLRQDVFNFYSSKTESDETLNKEYNIDNSIVKIYLTRIWVGKAEVCGVNVRGKVTVIMKEDSLMQEIIKGIIEGPKIYTMIGLRPLVNEIVFEQPS